MAVASFTRWFDPLVLIHFDAVISPLSCHVGLASLTTEAMDYFVANVGRKPNARAKTLET